MKYFDDIRTGERYEVGGYAFTADNIKDFARRFDPQIFHVDEEAAKRSHFGALCASGWQSAVVWMKLMVAYRKAEDAALRARGEGVAAVGLSPGFRDLKWLKPVYAGDVVSYVTEVMETRRSASRPGWGLVTMRTVGSNQKGEPVISFTGVSFIERRPGTQ